MRKKIVLLLICIVACSITLVACQNNKSKSSVVNIAIDYMRATRMDVINNQDKINQFLKEKGCKYSINYVIFGSEDAMLHYKSESFVNDVLDYVENSGNIDIVCACSLEDNNYCTTYELFRQQKALYPLDEYLQSEEGKSLYESIPKAKWESLRRNGLIYGINGYNMNSNVMPVYILNKKILEKHGYSEQDIKGTIADFVNVIVKIQEAESNNQQYVSVVLGNDFCDSWSEWYTPQGLQMLSCIGIDEAGKVRSIFDNESYIEYLRSIYTTINDNNISYFTSTMGLKTENVLLTIGSCVAPWISIDSMYTQNYAISDDRDYIKYYPYGCKVMFRSNNSAVCIMQSSNNKEEAMNFINLVYSDHDLSDIMAYGCTENDMQLINGKPYMEEKSNDEVITYGYSNYASWIFANGFLTAPAGNDVANKAEVIKLYEDMCDTYQWDEFFVDYKKNIKEYEAILETMIDFCTNMMTADDFDKYINNAREKLENAGINKLIADIQKDFDEWRSIN